LYLDQEAIDTTTPMGKLVFQVAGAFAEFERTTIRQRVKAGLKRAVAQGDTQMSRQKTRRLRNLWRKPLASARQWCGSKGAYNRPSCPCH
jgi:DNA invertase Pin-like site-specific DNA recombinase